MARLLDLLRHHLNVPRIPITKDNTVETSTAYPTIKDTMRIVGNHGNVIASDYIWRQWNATKYSERPTLDQFGCVAPARSITWIEGKTPNQIYVGDKLSENNFCSATGALVTRRWGASAHDVWSTACRAAKLDDEVLTKVRGLGMGTGGLLVITWFAMWRGNAVIGPMSSILIPLTDTGAVMPYAFAITGTERTTAVAESWAAEGIGPVLATLALMNSDRHLLEEVGRGGRDNEKLNRARERKGSPPVSEFHRLTWNPPEAHVHSFGSDEWLPVGIARNVDELSSKMHPGELTDEHARAVARIQEGIFPHIGCTRSTLMSFE